MTHVPFAARRLCVATLAPVALFGWAGAGLAQNTQALATVPGLDTYSLPTQPERPTPLVTPEPRIAPLPRPTPLATPVAPATPVPLPSPARVTLPSARATPPPSPRPSATPTPVSTSAAAKPIAPPSPIATPAPAAPSPVATIGATPQPVQPQSNTLPYWAAGVGLAAIIAGVLLYRRRRGAGEADVAPLLPPPPRAPEPPDEPAIPLVPEAGPRAHIAIDLEVKRAGTNLLSAAVEYRIVLHNPGDADARGIALDLRLFGIEPGLEGALEALFAAPVGQPAVARFDLAAGATAALEGTAMLPRTAMPTLALESVGEGRALFVPVMTVNLHYGWDGGTGQSAAAFVVGIDRGADAKLGPFRLDGPPRMHDRVRQLRYTVSRVI